MTYILHYWQAQQYRQQQQQDQQDRPRQYSLDDFHLAPLPTFLNLVTTPTTSNTSSLHVGATSAAATPTTTSRTSRRPSSGHGLGWAGGAGVVHGGCGGGGASTGSTGVNSGVMASSYGSDSFEGPGSEYGDEVQGGSREQQVRALGSWTLGASLAWMGFLG